MFGYFVNWDPSMGPNTHFGTLEWTQGPKNHFLDFVQSHETYLFWHIKLKELTHLI